MYSISVSENLGAFLGLLIFNLENVHEDALILNYIY